jgi:hypothetical protein
LHQAASLRALDEGKLNAFYYRNCAPGEEAWKGSWSQEETDHLLRVAQAS